MLRLYDDYSIDSSAQISFDYAVLQVSGYA